jgi:hypothetical protein
MMEKRSALDPGTVSSLSGAENDANVMYKDPLSAGKVLQRWSHAGKPTLFGVLSLLLKHVELLICH